MTLCLFTVHARTLPLDLGLSFLDIFERWNATEKHGWYAARKLANIQKHRECWNIGISRFQENCALGVYISGCIYIVPLELSCTSSATMAIRTYVLYIYREQWNDGFRSRWEEHLASRGFQEDRRPRRAFPHQARLIVGR